MSDIAFKTTLSDEISMSEEAITQMLKIVNNESDVAGVRIFITGGGCSGMTYGMTLIEEPLKYDTVWEKNGLKVFLDAVALNFLTGVEIDFRTEGANQNFVFNNVFAKTGGSGGCSGCGSAKA